MTLNPEDVAGRLTAAQSSSLMKIAAHDDWIGAKDAGTSGVGAWSLVNFPRGFGQQLIETAYRGDWSGYKYRATDLGRRVSAILREERP